MVLSLVSLLEEDVAVACFFCARFTNCQKIVAAVEKAGAAHTWIEHLGG